jgi:anti-sigma factor RsiW
MMMTDAFTDRLSDYVDDDIGAGERAAIEAHVATCADCRDTVEDLRSVVQRAASLEDSAPGRNLWPGIAARLAEARGPGMSLFRRLAFARRFSFTLPQLAAASLAIMLLSGGVVWMARSGDPRADFEPVSAHGDVRPQPAPAMAPADFSDTHYNEAVADLEQALDAGRTHLDPATVRILEENLASIDRAIDQSRRALAADPANVYLNRHLADARQRKLSLLRRATALAGG